MLKRLERDFSKVRVAMAVLVLVKRWLRLKAALCFFSALAKELSLDCISYHRLVALIYMLRFMIGAHIVCH